MAAVVVGALLSGGAAVAQHYGSAVSSEPSELQIRIEPEGIDENAAQALTQALLEREEVRRRLEGSHYRVLSADFGYEQPSKETVAQASGAYRIAVYDYTRNRLLNFSGSMEDASDFKIQEGRDILGHEEPPVPTPEEFDDAVRILEGDPALGGNVRDGELKPYPAMPGVILPDRLANGGALPRDHSRVIAIGLMPKDTRSRQGPAHEIVGVNLSRPGVIRYARGAPPATIAAPATCGVPNAGQAVTRRGTPGQARLAVQDAAGNELWKMLVVRPSASSGGRGSAIDLRDVTYRGRKVLSQMHVPILNVKYNFDVCGPYRDWQFSENPFQARGSLLASGILQASEPPRTVFESGRDLGNFRGVAVFTQNGILSLVTELEAGWYRYKAEFRFHPDGTIEPRWTFGAVQDSCTCRTHVHHAYWRFDFDVEGAERNRVLAFNGSTWNDLRTETRQNRSANVRAWRVLNPTTGNGYELVPGANDGTAQGDAYGKGDFWALRFRRGEIDDSSVYAGTSNNLNAFLGGESIWDQDLVLWYGAHFRHAAGDEEAGAHVVGPVLRPVTW